MKKVVLIVLGVLGVIAGLALAAGGIALMALFGTDGTYDAPHERIDTATHALVSEPVDLKHGAPFDAGGDITVRLTAQAIEGGDVFLGVGPAREVDAYLRGAAHDVVTEWRYGDHDQAISKRRVDGEATPAPPGEQRFWTVEAAGAGEQHIAWKLRGGTYRLVLMNGDGSAGVDVRGRWGVEIPWIFPLGIGLLAAGVVALGVGVLLLVLGIRTRTRPVATPTTTVGSWTVPPAPGSPPPPGTPPWPPPPTG
jgi:hypothetical protein